MGFRKEEQQSSGASLGLCSPGPLEWEQEAIASLPVGALVCTSLRNANKAMIHLSHRVSTSSKWQ